MNEYKIQLESRDDLTFLKDEMIKFFNENNDENISEATKQQVKMELYGKMLLLFIITYTQILFLPLFRSTLKGCLLLLPRIVK